MYIGCAFEVSRTWHRALPAAGTRPRRCLHLRLIKLVNGFIDPVLPMGSHSGSCKMQTAHSFIAHLSTIIGTMALESGGGSLCSGNCAEEKILFMYARTAA